MIVEIRVQRLSPWDAEEHVRLVETQDMSKVMGALTDTASRYAKVRRGHWRATAWSMSGMPVASVSVSPDATASRNGSVRVGRRVAT